VSSVLLAATFADRQAAAKRARANVERVQTMTEEDIRAVLADLRATRERLAARLASGGTEFDQAFARSMIADVDREVERLKREVGPKFASLFTRVMDTADSNALTEATQQIGRQLFTAPGIDTTLINFARENSADLVQQIGDDLRTRINTTLRRSAVGTSTPTDVGRAIGDVVRTANRDPGVFGNAAVQVERILRTETARLYEGASEARYKRIETDTGLRMTKQWVHVSGRIPGVLSRPDHAALNGVTIPLDEHFNVGAGPQWSRVSYEEAQRKGGTLGYRASAPQDSTLPAQQAVNCRCTTAPGFAED